jgi:putative PIN family toxin of toxin-antitoxin system
VERQCRAGLRQGLLRDIASNMRVVIDTNVFVAALRSTRGASAEIFRRVRNNNIRMIASVPLMFEYEAVASRIGHLESMGLSLRDIGIVLDALASLVEPVTIHFLWRPLLRDAGDDMVLEAAANGRANKILTFNGRHFTDECGKFGIEVMTPGEFIRSN